MLKWTVTNRRESTHEATTTTEAPVSAASRSCITQRRNIDGVRERKQRRHSARRASLCVRPDKENRCVRTFTPPSTGSVTDGKALRDVSNITPTANTIIGGGGSRASTGRSAAARKSIYTDDETIDTKSPGKLLIRAKKKKCLNPAHTLSHFADERAALNDEKCACTNSMPQILKPDNQNILHSVYASTLPSFQMEYSPCLRDAVMPNPPPTVIPYTVLPHLKPFQGINIDENCSPSKKPKIDHVNDFLNQISFITSPEDLKLRKQRQNAGKQNTEVTVSPLLEKFVDLRFSQISYENVDKDDSSGFNDMSLDKIVDAILDTTVDSSERIHPPSKEKTVIEKPNVEKEILAPDKSQNTDEEELPKRKRSSTSLSEDGSSFYLKRQKCIRRRKQTNLLNNNEVPYDNMNATPTSAINAQNLSSNRDAINDNSFSSSCVSGKRCSVSNSQNFEQSSVLSQQIDCLSYSPWKKEICCGLSTPSLERFAKDFVFKRKRALTRSVSDQPMKIATSSTPTKYRDSSVSGTIDLQFSHTKGHLNVHVFRCQDLQRSNGRPVNAYVKVTLVSDSDTKSKKRNGPQRTAVQAESNQPKFDHKFTFRLSKFDLSKKVQVEVWHRDRNQRRSEFLGCMSIPVKHAIKKEINGTYKLQSQTLSRSEQQNQQQQQQQQQNQQHIINKQSSEEYEGTGTTITMGENSQSSVEEAFSIEDGDTEIVKKASSKTSLNQQQKDADENLFLRYLELDPTEGPEAIPAALQRKASGNKCGRTPFTTTKRLVRAPRTGFGFSVVWTHPPRIERVEKGLPADKAGILPGDYIIFVDKHNVVMMPEIDILNLIRSYGSTLTLEIFRRTAATSKNGGITTTQPPMSNLPNVPNLPNNTLNGSELAIPLVTFQTLHRPSTGCSTNTTSMDLSRRRLHLPQVTFSSEKPLSSPDEARNRAMYQLINKEQQYVTALQFAVTRFVSALLERKDLITPHEHHVLFQNSEEILRITEDLLETIVNDEGEPQIHLLSKAYELKLNEIISAYKRYCSGLKRADYLLVTKTKNSNSEFVRFLQTPAIPRRRPDITSFIHKPLEHYRDILKLLSTILSNTKTNHEDYSTISRVVHELQTVYREITAEAGLMEPTGEGRPLLSVQDLENRLVFTKCKPFVLSKPGRQWIFGGDLSRVEGRTIRTYWALLFSDLILFAKVSRDRVLFITEEPLPLSHITEIYFNVRKKATEFRITVEPGGRSAQSPTAHCGPDLTRTPRKNAGKRCVVLRAPTMELKAVWQNLLQRQLFHVNSGVDGSSLSSPLESPDAPITSSVATLQSAESLSIRRQGQRRVNSSMSSEMQKQIDQLIEHKCKQLSKTSSNKDGAIHLEQWMKGQLGQGRIQYEYEQEPEPEPELWSEDELRKRSEKLQLDDDVQETLTKQDNQNDNNRAEEQTTSDHERSPSRSTTTESQVTVRSSPVVPEQVSVCKQCHETCLSNTNSPNLNIHHTNNNVIHNKCPNKDNINNRITNNTTAGIREDDENEWGSLMLMGLAAINPTTSFVKLDPFAPKIVPKIAVVPPTPEQTSVNNTFSGKFNYPNDVTDSPSKRKKMTNLELIKDYEDSPDDSPQNEQPYVALENCNQTLRRFGTLSSLEKLTNEDFADTLKNSSSGSEEDEEDDEEEEEELSTKTDPGKDAFASSLRNWTAKAGSFVSERMTFFERFNDDSHESFFARYWKQSDLLKNLDEDGNIALDEECETSGATSGEEIWGTPTSGGELEETHSFPNSEGGNLSPQSVNSMNGDDDTELMMDELLMAPPITAAAVRGLLPRRRLEPLMEEDDSDTYTSSSSSSEKATPSPEEGNGTGDVADDCSSAVLPGSQTALQQSTINRMVPGPSTSPVEYINPPLARSRSYRHIVEEVEEADFLSRCSPHHILNLPPVVTKFKSIEPNSRFANRAKTARIFAFFNSRRSERRVHESFASSRQLIRVFSKDDDPIPESVPSEYTQKPLSPMLNKDKQMDRRFWRQLSKRRRANRVPQIPA